MKLNIYAIYDSAAALYFRPLFQMNDKTALRAFGDLCQQEEEPVCQHPEDYALFKIGTYDDNSAVITPSDRVCLITALEAKAQRGISIEPDQLEFSGMIGSEANPNGKK